MSSSRRDIGLALTGIKAAKVSRELPPESDGVKDLRPELIAAAALVHSLRRNVSIAAALGSLLDGRLCVVVGNTHTINGSAKVNTHQWCCFVRVPPHLKVKSVTFDLHPTFTPSAVTLKAPTSRDGAYSVTRMGWGVFMIGIEILTANGKRLHCEHYLSFDAPLTSSEVEFDY